MSNLSIGTNSQNDIYLDVSGSLVMVSDVQAVLQDCEHALKAQLGEMVLAVENGMPTIDAVFQTEDLDRWVGVGRQTLLNIAGVDAVLSFVADKVNDVLIYTAVIRTVYSPNAITITTTSNVDTGQ